MLEIWESVETILLLTTSPSDTPSFLEKALSTPGFVWRIITDGYHWIRRKGRKISKNNLEALSRDNLTTKQVVIISNAHGNISLYTN